MPRQFADGVDRVGVIHEDKPAHDGVKWPVEVEFRRVAFRESYVVDVSRLRPRRRPVHGCGSAVDADDLSARSDEVGGQKGYVSAATAHIKNPHARGDSGLLE
jgi:hypothetical protein